MMMWRERENNADIAPETESDYVLDSPNWYCRHFAVRYKLSVMLEWNASAIVHGYNCICGYNLL